MKYLIILIASMFLFNCSSTPKKKLTLVCIRSSAYELECIDVEEESE